MRSETITERADLIIRRHILERGEALPWHVDRCHRFTVVVSGEAIQIEYLDSDNLRVGYVRKQEHDRLHLVDPRGRNVSVNGDRVVIETTGMADPGPVAQTFFMDDDIASYYLLDAVLTVVDAKHGHDTLDKQPEAQNQVGFADRILLTKTDLVSDDETASLKERLVQMNPRAPIKAVNFGQVPIKDVLDLRGFNLNAILEIDPAFLAGEHPDAVKARKEEDHDHGHDDHGHHHDHDHDHDHHHHHHDDAIKAFVFQSSRPFDPAKLEEYMGALTQVYGQDMLRYKGVLFMNGTNRRMIFQGVHMLMGADVGRPWGKDEKPSTKIVFIGRNLPKEAILKGLEACLAR